MFDSTIFLVLAFAAGFYFRTIGIDKTASDTSLPPKEVSVTPLPSEVDAQVASLTAKNLALARENQQMREAEARRIANSARYQQQRDESDLRKTDNQLRFIGAVAVDLEARAPVNREAVKVMYALDSWIKRNRPEWRLSFEVAMGAFVKTSGAAKDADNAFSSYNSKRVDFLLIDRFGMPKLVVEYNGTGHDLSGDAAARMSVKKLALSRARIPLLEVPAHTSPQQIHQQVHSILAQAAGNDASAIDAA